MSLKVAIQMDPIWSVDIDADSTFRLAEDAQARGHELFFFTPDQLLLRDGEVRAKGWPITVRRTLGDHVATGERAEISLAEWDVVLLRQDPPFDMGYITTTHLLERVHPQTLVVNDPAWVRNSPEKLMVLDYADLMPTTAIARDIDTLRDFHRDHGDVIVKPLYGNGGAGVFRLRPGDPNLASLHELFTGLNREPLIAQAYVPEVKNGDKRIILIDGEPVGAINRIPAEGETRSNLHVGGKAVPSDLTERDREICARLGPDLKEKGLIFVGIDVIGDRLTEINVTSPTGIQELERFSGVNSAALFWDAVEKKISRV